MPVMTVGLAWLLGVMAMAVWTVSPDRKPLGSVAVTAVGPIYTAVLPSSILIIRHGGEASAWGATWLVFLPLAMTWICDTFAMAGGSMFGGPKLAPVVSPNKTWSGAVSGLVGSVLVALIFATLVLPALQISLSIWQGVALGVAVGVLGQTGDLAESLFKRSAGVKDSGRFFPGHGGVLDRLDSLYWVLPISAVMLASFGILGMAS